MATQKTLEHYLRQLRLIEEHREKWCEQNVKRYYKELMTDLREFLGVEYANLAQDDKLTYEILQSKGQYARFLEEVERRINTFTPKAAKEIRDTVQLTYKAAYEGMISAVEKSTDIESLKLNLKGLKGTRAEVIKRAVENPISGLTLNDTLEKNRKEVIYDIKQQIGIGLSQGDRMSTMARRISEQVDMDYRKATRIVRTETHRVREMGYQDSAEEINQILRDNDSDVVMVKIWRTMKDERVRPQRAAYKRKAGVKPRKKYTAGLRSSLSGPNHLKMEGQIVLVDEDFDLGGGVKAKTPGQSGVAGHDINCRCYASKDIMTKAEYEKLTGKKIESKPKSEPKPKPKPKVEEPIIDDVVEPIRYTSDSRKTINNKITDWEKGISKDERKSASIYAGSVKGKEYEYEKINGYLRGSTSKITAGNKKIIDDLDKITSSYVVDEPFTVIRGVNADAFRDLLDRDTIDWISSQSDFSKDDLKRLNDLLNGKTYSDKAFTSTSWNTHRGFYRDVNLEINVPAGFNNGAFIHNLSGRPDEAEFLIGRNAKFKITNVRLNKNKQLTFDIDLLSDDIGKLSSIDVNKLREEIGDLTTQIKSLKTTKSLKELKFDTSGKTSVDTGLIGDGYYKISAEDYLNDKIIKDDVDGYYRKHVARKKFSSTSQEIVSELDEFFDEIKKAQTSDPKKLAKLQKLLKDKQDELEKVIEKSDLTSMQMMSPRSKSAKILDKLQNFADSDPSKYDKNNTIRDVAQVLNKSIDEARVAVSESLKDIIDECDIGIRIRANNLEKVLDDGGFKNLFETGTGEGCTDFEARGYGEKDVFGYLRAIPSKSDAEDRPIYGMMIPNLKNDKTKEAIDYINDGPGSWYGDGVTVVVKKNKVFNNASFTLGDSLDYDHVLYASTFDNPQFNGAFDFFEDNVKKLVDKSKTGNRRLLDTFDKGNNYLEVQIHGKENHAADIIETVYFDEPAFKRAKDRGLIDKLDAKEIPYEVLKK